MALPLQLETVLLFCEQVLRLVQVDEEYCSQDAGSQMQPKDEGDHLGVCDSIHDLPPQGVWEGQGQNQEQHNLED